MAVSFKMLSLTLTDAQVRQNRAEAAELPVCVGKWPELVVARISSKPLWLVGSITCNLS